MNAGEKMPTIDTILNLHEKRSVESDRSQPWKYQPPAQRAAGWFVRVVVSSNQNTIASCTHTR
jgi:hypothetical protein